jgi:hypothetical protein
LLLQFLLPQLFFVIVTTLSHMQAVGLFCALAVFLLEFAQLINWLNGGRRQGGEAHAQVRQGQHAPCEQVSQA